jgi:hypothetical protein
MFHGRHLFRRETAPAFSVPDWDIRAGFFAATSLVEQTPCRGRVRQRASAR